MKNKNQKTKISYDPEADILRIEISKRPIDHAMEIGNIIVHFSSNDLPVYLEILEAKKFLLRTGRILEKAGAFEFAGKVT